MNLHEYDPRYRMPANIDLNTWNWGDDAYGNWMYRVEHNIVTPHQLDKAVLATIKRLYDYERSRDDRKQEWEKDQERVYRRLDKSQNRINALKKKVKTLEEKIAWIQGK